VFIKKHWVNSLFYLMLQQFIALVLFGMGNSNWVVVCVHTCVPHCVTGHTVGMSVYSLSNFI